MTELTISSDNNVINLIFFLWQKKPCDKLDSSQQQWANVDGIKLDFNSISLWNLFSFHSSRDEFIEEGEEAKVM